MLQVRDKVRNQIQDGGTMADNSSSSPGQEPTAAQENTPAASSIVVKKYANRRLYNTETSSYITLDNLAEMIRAGRDFAVYDAKSGEDITRGVLTQIIVEEESKGSAMLPTTFLRQLIGFYGGSLQGVVPRYLDQAMTTFARQQQQMRQMVERTLSPFLPSGVEEMNRKNMAVFERAISMWNPFHRDEPEGGEQQAEGGAEQGDAALRQEIESLREQLAAAQSQNQTPAPSADPAEVDVMRNEIDRLRHQLAAAQSQGPAPAPSADPAELDALRRELGDVRHQLAAAQAAAAPDRSEVGRLQQEVDSLKQQLAAAHAAAVAPAAATAIVPQAAPANVLADPAGTNGALKPARKPVARPKVAGDATRS